MREHFLVMRLRATYWAELTIGYFIIPIILVRKTHWLIALLPTMRICSLLNLLPAFVVFDYATQYGTSVAVLNAEFRIPLVRALSGGPITSNFFRNLQFTGFLRHRVKLDWPYSFCNANEGRIREVVHPPFTIDIKEYLNPWLYSYGFGFRSMIFGYYIKCDLAWPVANYKVQDPRAQVSLGFDF